MSELASIFQSVRISQIYQALTGVSPKCIRGPMYRGPAPWRSGDNPSAVSLDDERGIWHDFVTDQGGGILDLVITAKGGTKAEALRWVADFAGMPLLDDSRPDQSNEDLERWREHKRILAAELQLAQYWKRGAVKMSEELLEELKAPLLESQTETAFSLEIGEIYDTTRFLRRLQSLDGLELIEEYHSFLELQPGFTAAFVRWAKEREQQERRAVLRYLGLR